MSDRLPRLTADHSVGASISGDDLWWLITQVHQLRTQLTEAKKRAVPMAGVAVQCTVRRDLHDANSRCSYSTGHAGRHSYDPVTTGAPHQCIPHGTESLRECTYVPGHRCPHSFEVGAKDIWPATSPPRWCRGRTEEHLHCAYRYGHSGLCSYAEDGDHEDTYQ